MDFTLSPDVDEFRLHVRDFVAEHILALESEANTWDEGENIRDEALNPLRAKSREAGLWCPQMTRAPAWHAGRVPPTAHRNCTRWCCPEI